MVFVSPGMSDGRGVGNPELARNAPQVGPGVDAAAVAVAEDQVQPLVADRADVVDADVRRCLDANAGGPELVLAAAALAGHAEQRMRESRRAAVVPGEFQRAAGLVVHDGFGDL